MSRTSKFLAYLLIAAGMAAALRAGFETGDETFSFVNVAIVLIVTGIVFWGAFDEESRDGWRWMFKRHGKEKE